MASSTVDGTAQDGILLLHRSRLILDQLHEWAVTSFPHVEWPAWDLSMDWQQLASGLSDLAIPSPASSPPRQMASASAQDRWPQHIHMAPESANPPSASLRSGTVFSMTSSSSAPPPVLAAQSNANHSGRGFLASLFLQKSAQLTTSAAASASTHSLAHSPLALFTPKTSAPASPQPPPSDSSSRSSPDPALDSATVGSMVQRFLSMLLSLPACRQSAAVQRFLQLSHSTYTSPSMAHAPVLLEDRRVSLEVGLRSPDVLPLASSDAVATQNGLEPVAARCVDSLQHSLPGPSCLRERANPLAALDALATVASMERNRETHPVATPTSPVMGMKRSLDDYELVKVIGKGCMGKVLLARERGSRRLFALKAISKHWVASHGAREIEHTKAEQKILANLSLINHPFLMKLHCSFQSVENLFLVVDYVGGGDLATQLAKWHRFCETRARFYCAEMVMGILELHRLGIIYRDLKPENVLLDPSGHIKLTDFGLSKQFKLSHKMNENDGVDCPGGDQCPHQRTRTFCGTAEYLAPEILLEQPYSFEVDWWSLGTFLYEMLTGITPFWAENHAVMYRRVLEDELEFPGDLVSNHAQSIIRGFLTRNPVKRLGYGCPSSGSSSADSPILSHPFFASLDWNDLYEKRIMPPYVPRLRGEVDLSNFDEEFTRMTPRLSPVPVTRCMPNRTIDPTPLDQVPGGTESGSCGLGQCECSSLLASVQDQFAGYTFVSSSADRLMTSHLSTRAVAGNGGLAPPSVTADFAGSPSREQWYRYTMKRRRGSSSFQQPTAQSVGRPTVLSPLGHETVFSTMAASSPSAWMTPSASGATPIVDDATGLDSSGSRSGTSHGFKWVRGSSGNLMDEDVLEFEMDDV